jgi:hypothetical protein
MSQLAEKLESLAKALEAGGYNAVPTTLTQGSALQVEDCSPVMYNVTFNDKHIKLQKALNVKSVKSVFIQFNRRLSYGQFGGSAQIEGAVGQEQTSDFVRVGVPMAFYSELRRTTLVSNMVKTQSGEKPEDLEAEAAALRIAADIEFDLFRGKADFSNAGVFDGNPNAVPPLPNMMGVDLQIRQSDLQTNTQDLMFESFSSGLSVVLNGGGVLTQPIIEDASVRSAINHGSADTLYIDPLVLSAYNKLAYANKERIVLAGSPQTAVGADVQRQWVSGGTVKTEASRFLSGKTQPIRARAIGPATPLVPTSAQNASSTTFVAAQVYNYYTTQENEIGESSRSPALAVTILVNGNNVVLSGASIAPTSKIMNVYRSAAGGTAASAKFIGRVATNGSATPAFTDLNNKVPGFVTGFLLQDDTMEIAELAPYSRMKMAVADLSEPEAHFRFCCLKVTEPRKNVLVDNLKGDQSF